jgi:aryl-alcohol dehydrogenase-like predicted oxidoreductase
MVGLERRRLGASSLEVSRLALGSWRTFERISRDAGLAVMHAARDSGINFLDDARYNDETGRAPLKTGYSEVVFGELFRSSGWRRDEVVVANKLWWEFWPEQSAAQEVDASLGRMKLDHLDLVYAERPPEGLTVPQVVDDVTSLITAGKVRAWGVLNWPAELIAEAAAISPPCAAQLPYNLVIRGMVEDRAMENAVDTAGAGIVASYTLYGGALSGKYADPAAEGRIAAHIDDRDYAKPLAAAAELAALGRELGATPAALALAFALLNERVTSVLFGATTPEQITQNLVAVDLAERLDASSIARLRRIGD